MTKNRLGELLFYLIIALHLAAAVTPIRSFPLTDYPMFTQIYDGPKTAGKITFVSVFGEQLQEWQRQDYATVGFNSGLLQAYVNDPHNPEVRRFLKEKMQLQKGNTAEKPDAIIIRRTIYLLKDDKLVEKTEDIEKVPYAELEL